MPQMVWHIAGVMSGTSLDGVDAVIVRLEVAAGRMAGAAGSLQATIRGQASIAYPEPLREELLTVQAAQAVGFTELAGLEAELDALTVQAVGLALESAQLKDDSLDAVAMHGQTMYHQPPANDSAGFTWQWGNPAVVAGSVGAPVVAQFRQGDMAVGGQGAPLVPYAQALLYGDRQAAFLNIGGIANVTVFPSQLPLETPVWQWQGVYGFDTGPGNMLLDAAAQHFFQQPYDKNGDLAAQGHVNSELLARCQQHPYYSQPAPKSTGREQFGRAYFSELLVQFPTVSPHDWLATLTELTAWSIADALTPYALQTLIVSGGGALNSTLMARLAAHCAPEITITTAEAALGMGNTHMECVAFAVLGWARLQGLPATLPTCTGARQPVPLGGVWLPNA